MNQIKQYENSIYAYLLFSAIILGFISNQIPYETIKAITVNLSSELLAVALLFFLFRYSLDREREKEQKRQAGKVTVMLCNGARKIKLPIELYRAELTRAEILGRIGMIPRKTEKFFFNFFNTMEFIDQIRTILASEGDSILMIPCDEHEFSQFD
jgi:hypothetical protein